MDQSSRALADRFRRELDKLGVRGTGAHVVVALSGGMDSVALLHLLRFAADDGGLTLTAAHFDHAMRAESAADAHWAAGLCRAWGVPLRTGRAGHPPRTEAEARDARYAFLRGIQAESGATHLATAHHADDQAETVLFRVLRGTGLRGLAGIPAADAAGLIRPLLPFWRADLRAYARAAGLRWRRDPTNRALEPSRNRLRHRVLPQAERVAPGARRALVRLAALAREDEAAWDAVLAPLVAESVREENGALLLVRDRFAAYDWPVAARVLRLLLRRVGAAPDRAGTRLALEFISNAASGRTLRLSGGVRITTEFGTARVERGPGPETPPPDAPLLISAVPGEGGLALGGSRLAARWTAEDDAPADARWTLRVGADPARFPLLLRGWLPGDRIRTHAGTRTLKKLLGEARVPMRARLAVPVLADAHGTVLWVAGVAAAADAGPRPGEPAITLWISDA
jgi:tRNA(Ile)-lysidine synthase